MATKLAADERRCGAVVLRVTLLWKVCTRRSSRILKFTRIRMDSIEGNIRLLLQGKEVEESQDFCDFTLQDQNEVTGKRRRKEGAVGRNARQVRKEGREEKWKFWSSLASLISHHGVQPVVTPSCGLTVLPTHPVSQSVSGRSSIKNNGLRVTCWDPRRPGRKEKMTFKVTKCLIFLTHTHTHTHTQYGANTKKHVEKVQKAATRWVCA